MAVRVGLRDRWRLVVGAAQEHAARQHVVPSPGSVVAFAVPTVDEVITTAAESWRTGSVSRDVALQVPAVLRGRNLICSISTLPLVTVDKDKRRIPSPLLDQIDQHVSNIVTLAMTVEDLLMDAVAWWRVTGREPAPAGALGFPRWAEHVSTSRVTTDPPPGFDVRSLPSGIDPDSVVWVDGRVVDGRDMIRFDSPNPALLVAARRAIRRAAKLEMAAERYADDPKALEFFTPAEGADPLGDTDEDEDAEIKKILDAWQAARRKRSAAYVPAALEHHTIPWMSPADLQLAELQKRAALDIANAIGLDPEDLGISTTSRTYQNASDRRQDRINEVLSPYMLAITSRLSMNDVTRRGQAVSFDLAGLLKPDPLTRTSYYSAMKALEAMTTEEIRAAEGLPPLPAGSAGQTESGRPAAGEENNVRPIRASVPVAFSGGTGRGLGDVRVAFAAAAMDAEGLESFRVSRETRTIKGSAIPYGVVASNGWARWKFLPGSLSWSDASRVKFLLEHNPSRVLGVATDLTDSKRQLKASFRVASADHADHAFRDAALADAADGILDGLSVGVSMDPEGVEWSDEEKCYVVSKATLREVSLVSIPAFDDARLTSVAASSTGGSMHCPLCGQDHAAGTPCQSVPSTAALSTQTASAAPATVPAPAPVSVSVSVGAEFAEQLAAALVAAGPDVPAVVSPRAGARTALSVREPLPYRFDGRRGEHDFSTDLFALARQHADADTQRRIETFLREAFADVSTGDVNELNPTRNRADMFVDNMDFTTPIWDAINKGSIDDATPFTVPSFNSAAGLVADHSEGVEPTGGTYTTTGQTITPGALSGVVEITRETIDQGGNPQASALIWGEIKRAYSEALEVKAVDLLDGLTPTGIALNGIDADLDSDITANIAALAFVRGGNRFRDFFVDSSLFTALVSAVDDNGRKLFPILAPQNATGTTGGDFGDVLVGTLRARPAWALEVANGGSASSYLFNRFDCHGWATPPQRLEFQYQVKSVWLGVWGYVATANTRLAGVREVTYSAI